ncbi:LOW QUALITY PROTEIN: reverse transcriptase [Phytophthora megakarya]|uniref:Reverse transcriptase n=1 Tax=Phytophthora megakarya TaxID=4795 RepID=A0A225VJQ6_9STRA|nr:LOW QUALITY PROTEIN: reverse transcriptase [Phytophthora megakarya]
MTFTRPRRAKRRIAQAQDVELGWSNLKSILKGETTAMTYKEAREAWKWGDNVVLSSGNILYRTGVSRRKVEENLPEMLLRLVPTTMIQEVLHNCHDSIERGHQGVAHSYPKVKHDYYWIGLYADVDKQVKLCLNCSSSKSLPQLKSYLLCSFTGLVVVRVMPDTDALTVVEECINMRFGASSLIRHAWDPRFMSEVFQVFAELIQARPRSALSYRPQANGQQERSVKTVMQSVKAYVDAERLERDTISFGAWMGCPDDITSDDDLSEALAWQREINRYHQISLEPAKEYQAAEKARCTRLHNKKLSRKEQAAIPKSVNDDSSDDDSEPKSLFRPGIRVWLYLRVNRS